MVNTNFWYHSKPVLDQLSQHLSVFCDGQWWNGDRDRQRRRELERPDVEHRRPLGSDQLQRYRHMLRSHQWLQFHQDGERIHLEPSSYCWRGHRFDRYQLPVGDHLLRDRSRVQPDLHDRRWGHHVAVELHSWKRPAGWNQWSVQSHWLSKHHHVLRRRHVGRCRYHDRRRRQLEDG